jgi:hypothetical protein
MAAMITLLRRSPVVLKQMLHRRTLFLAGCVVCAGLILIDLGSTGNRRALFEAPAPPAGSRPAMAEIRKLADPQSSPTRHRPDAPASADGADSPLHDVRLTGVVIGPGLRIAIFAVNGANPLALSEGEALRGWRLKSISAEKVVLSDGAGSMTLAPKPDANLARSPPPAAAWAGQFAPATPSVMAIPSAPVQPISVTPITVVNLPAPLPVPAYPQYSPEYYDTGYGPYLPSFNNYLYPFPLFAFGVPRRAGFRFGSFHHHGFHHGGFRSIAFHGGGHGRRR